MKQLFLNPMFKKKTGVKKPKPKKGPIREWVDSLVFAVIAATIIRWLFIEPYTVPTGSMERTILVGDFLFVSKLHYGPRTVKTPLQLPLTHQKIWGTTLPSFSRLIDLPMFRLPGFSEVKKNDIVVFNYPPEFELPEDLRTYYVKRCVGIAGDSILIDDQRLLVNGEALNISVAIQQSFFLRTSQSINDRVFKRYHISDYVPLQGGYEIYTDAQTAKDMGNLNFVEDVFPVKYDKNNPYGKAFSAFVKDVNFNWTIDELGPFYLPKAGDVMEMNPTNVVLYGWNIQHYEELDSVAIVDKQLFVNGSLQTHYTFKNDYYFMMGDNRHNSADSRIWGMVPKRFVVGKALFVWWSVSPEGGVLDLFKRIRWNRIFTQLN